MTHDSENIQCVYFIYHFSDTGLYFSVTAQDGEVLNFKIRKSGNHTGRYLKYKDDKMAI